MCVYDIFFAVRAIELFLYHSPIPLSRFTSKTKKTILLFLPLLLHPVSSFPRFLCLSLSLPLSLSLSLSLSFVSISFLFTKHIWFVVCLNQLFFLKNSYDYSDIVLVTAVTFKKQQKKH